MFISARSFRRAGLVAGIGAAALALVAGPASASTSKPVLGPSVITPNASNWEIVNVDSGKCLDAVWSQTNGTNIHQWDCYAGNTQRWYSVAKPGGYELVNVDSGKCLDAVWSHTNGTNIHQWDCYGGNTQLWNSVARPGGYEMVNVDSGKCLDAVWSHTNGTDIHQWDCYGGNTQLWNAVLL